MSRRPFTGAKSGGTGRCPPDIDRAAEIAAAHHPAWHRCTLAARKIHARNVCIVLGGDLKTPSDFVICWTSTGRATGGTGQAIRIAGAFDIPVYYL